MKTTNLKSQFEEIKSLANVNVVYSSAIRVNRVRLFSRKLLTLLKLSNTQSSNLYNAYRVSSK